MLFNSADFLIFFAAFYLAHIFVRPSRFSNAFTLFASYLFYAYWKVAFLGLILGLTIITFQIAKLLDRTSDEKRRKRLVAAAAVSSLGVLAVFKYLDFGIESFAAILGVLGLKAHLSTLGILLPVGISFITFQSLGYVVDVYRRQMEAESNFLNYALFVAFFPQLVAGPIERAAHLLTQFRSPRPITREDIETGVTWLAIGYFLKVAIADTIAPFVDYVFLLPEPKAASGITTLIGVLGFSLQIFGDFAGYSLIARGLARLMGIDIMANFRSPYLAVNPADFWRRWHISLSTWLRDYLYVPLGGSRLGRRRTYVNIMITMLLGGLWHGAAWNFVLWGGYHGLLLILHRSLRKTLADSRLAPVVRAARLPAMYLLISFGWLLFRSKDLTQFSAVVNNIVDNFYWEPQTGYALMVFLTLSVFTAAHHIWEERHGDWQWIGPLDWPLKTGLVLFCAFAVAGAGFTKTPFIYFQF